LEENIESKNRELAIATMAILKKNQFLQTILNDLENMESNPCKRNGRVVLLCCLGKG
jgi:hypothetical protein